MNEYLLQLYNVVGIYAVKRCFYFIKNFHVFYTFKGTVFYYWYLYLIATNRCTLRMDSNVRDGRIGFNHEYPAYCSLNTNHPLA